MDSIVLASAAWVNDRILGYENCDAFGLFECVYDSGVVWAFEVSEGAADGGDCG